jgi:uncharacterized protein YeaO (DUF488 family)
MGLTGGPVYTEGRDMTREERERWARRTDIDEVFERGRMQDALSSLAGARVTLHPAVADIDALAEEVNPEVAHQLRVYTAPLPTRGRPGYRGADALDITRGTGGPQVDTFAPSRELLNEGLRRKRAAKGSEARLVEAWAWYAPRYVAEMRASYRASRPQWEALLVRGEVVLCCYCGTYARCHRTLLAEILVKLGAIYLGELDAPAHEQRQVIDDN